MTTRGSRRQFWFWLLGSLPFLTIFGWHLSLSLTTIEPLVESWTTQHQSSLTLSHVRLNRYLNRVILTTSAVTEDQREAALALVTQLGATATPSYDLYTWLLPYRSEFHILRPPSQISLPPPPPSTPNPVIPSGPSSPETDPAVPETSSIAPESEEASRVRRLAQLRWLALLEGVTVGTLYKEGVPHTSFSGTLFNRHEYSLRHAVVRLSFHAPDGQSAGTQDFSLVPFMNPSISLNGLLPPKYRLPFSFTLSEPLPAGWTTRADLMVIEFDEPPPVAQYPSTARTR